MEQWKKKVWKKKKFTYQSKKYRVGVQQTNIFLKDGLIGLYT